MKTKKRRDNKKQEEKNARGKEKTMKENMP